MEFEIYTKEGCVQYLYPNANAYDLLMTNYNQRTPKEPHVRSADSDDSSIPKE